MKLLARKRLVTLLIIIFLVLILAFFLYYKYQSQFHYDVVNLENRSGIHLIKGRPAIKAFYVTNRLLKEGEETDEISDQLNYGIAFVQIPNGYHIGASFEKKLLAEEKLDEKYFFQRLRETIENSKSKLLVLWIHGYANSFAGTASVLARGAYDLNTEATYLFFSWPSQNRWFGYQDDVAQEKKSAPSLARFLEQLEKELPEARLVIIAHSLGTKLLCDTFDLLYAQSDWRNNEKEIQDVILIAPDVDEGDFDQQFKYQILSMARRLTIYVASDDRALLISHLKYGSKPLGMPTQFDKDSHLDESQALLELINQGLANLDIVDATYIVKPTFFSHSYYRSRAIISDIYWLLNNDAPTEKRQLYRSKLRKNINYWVLPP